jgi:hypothetical protein
MKTIPHRTRKHSKKLESRLDCVTYADPIPGALVLKINRIT